MSENIPNKIKNTELRRSRRYYDYIEPNDGDGGNVREKSLRYLPHHHHHHHRWCADCNKNYLARKRVCVQVVAVTIYIILLSVFLSRACVIPKKPGRHRGRGLYTTTVNTHAAAVPCRNVHNTAAAAPSERGQAREASFFVVR